MGLRTWATGARQLPTVVQNLYTPEVEFVFGSQEPTQATEESARTAMGDRSRETCPYSFGVWPRPLEVLRQRKRGNYHVFAIWLRICETNGLTVVQSWTARNTWVCGSLKSTNTSSDDGVPWGPTGCRGVCSPTES